ncbi:tryptophan halogenase family protein [Luteolibacter marinus]|uniref:tryptophan halogenase family protein n=1 Tax=Luteolibacter marinus TaxID=2776705 RepID=UPI001867D4DF|nr:tryptophan halogenase family protein [Luteolibacter marinus]
MQVRTVVVLGAGSSGLLAALTLKRRIPALDVEVIHSSKLGIIGVGEGTTPYVPSHLHSYLGLSEAEVFRAIEPVYKLGIRFTWGRRPHFDYTFSGQQYDWRWPDLPRNNGFYTDEDTSAIDLSSALMESGHALPRRSDGLPDVPPPGRMLAWHLENRRFVGWLETACRKQGVRFTDTEMTAASRDGAGGVAGIQLADGSSRQADLFIDSSGFGSRLLGKELEEPFDDYSNALFCDRAIAGGWDRGEEPILPYTLSETMKSGWCWQIDHPDRLHRGYVFSSDHLSDEQAADEFAVVAPQAKDPRVIRFRSGRYQRAWVGNVVAIGNAAGFVEPLEATALMVICLQCRWLADGLVDGLLAPNPTMRDLFNRLHRQTWDDIRDFLALHYKFNRRIDTPFWRRCHEETPLGQLEELVAFYQENGPSSLGRGLLAGATSAFGLEGYLSLLCGLGVPHQKPHHPASKEIGIWEAKRNHFRKIAADGMPMREAIGELRKEHTWKRLRGTR